MNRLFSTLAFVAVAITPALAQTPTVSASLLNLKPTSAVGCYKSSGSLTDQGSWTFQAMGNCQPLCVEQGLPVGALFNGSNCFCGNSMPSKDDVLDDSQCNTPCQGYPGDSCGGRSAYYWFLDGLPFSTATASTSKPTPTTMSTTAVPKTTQAITTDSSQNMVASTVFVTQPGSTSATIVYTTEVAEASGSSGSNKAAIAAGVVVGVIALLAIIGGLVFYLRQKKRRELAEEMRRHESITNFVTTGEKKPTSLSSMGDSRLEPTFNFGRRMSDGSIADNVDYSRRILKVRNPDDA